MQKIQNYAAKISTGEGRKYDHATPHINKLGWLKIENKCECDCCVFIYKVLNNLIPDWILTLTRVSDVNPRITRQINDLVVPRTSTLTGDRHVEVRGTKLWNSLPQIIKDISNFSTFKQKLRKFLLNTQL